MLLTVLKELFVRDLSRLREEVLLYKDENNLWKIEGDIVNSAGNLCLHLVGNLNAYIGAELGATGYVRQRDREFSDKNVSRQKLVQMVEDSSAMIEEVLDKLTEPALHEEYPLHVFKRPMTTEFFLVHLATHLNYHLGQVNYHRRLLD